MDYSLHPNAMVSFDFSPLSNIHKSVQRNSRTSKRKIRVDINRNATQAFLESGQDFSKTPTASPFYGFPSAEGPTVNERPDDSLLRDSSFKEPEFEIVDRRQHGSGRTI